MAFVKLHGSILDSSIWSQADTTRIVWITMLAMANEAGVVEASVDGVARRAVVSLDACEAAIAVLSGPDPHSRDGTTGERIEKVPGGWLVLNHANYREQRTAQQIATAKRVARHRAKVKREREEAVTDNVTESYRPLHSQTNANSPQPSPTLPNSPSEAEAEAEAEAVQKKRARKRATRFQPEVVLAEFPNLNTPTIRAALEGYYPIRRRPWTDQGMRLALRKLADLTETEVVHSIETAIEGSYDTIWPKPIRQNGQEEDPVARMRAMLKEIP